MIYKGSCHCGAVACKTCGIHTHGEGTDPKGNAVAAINLRCLDGVDLDKLQITPFNGRVL